MIDVIISLLIGFALGFTLLRKIKPMFAFGIVAIIGCLVGWQVLAVLAPGNTSVGYLLETTPEMSLVWQQTQDMRQVALISQYATYLWIMFNAIAAIFGCLFAFAYVKHKKRII